jgi:hypothetical protein
MAFVMVVTLWSLVLQVMAAARVLAASGVRLDAPTLNGLVALLLIALAAVLIVEAARALQSPPRVEAPAA